MALARIEAAQYVEAREQVQLRPNIQTMRANIGYAKRQIKHAPRRSQGSSIFQFQAMSAVEEARGAEGARTAEDALAARPLPKTRPMESVFTMLFITCGGATPCVTWRAISENSSTSPALQP